VTRWLVTGAGGMLGADLVAVLAGQNVTALTRVELDVTDTEAVDAAVHGADIVLNAAAYTNVDGAESEPARAMAVNGDGPRSLARACRRHGARLVHVSTDYVFSGTAEQRIGGSVLHPSECPPYAETAPTAPATEYGRGKLMGEQAVLTECPKDSYIVRTAWLYGAHGRNFVRTMIELERTRPTVDVVDDQWGQPTWAHELAVRLVALGNSTAEPGLYHVAGAGRATWFRLAQAVFAAVGADPDRVRPTTTDRFPRPAPRPAFSVLGQDRLAVAGLPPMPPWEESLQAALPALLRAIGEETP
jgi:dTDP-4-dehydrorhamnose reductase